MNSNDLTYCENCDQVGVKSGRQPIMAYFSGIRMLLKFWNGLTLVTAILATAFLLFLIVVDILFWKETGTYLPYKKGVYDWGSIPFEAILAYASGVSFSANWAMNRIEDSFNCDLPEIAYKLRSAAYMTIALFCFDIIFVVLEQWQGPKAEASLARTKFDSIFEFFMPPFFGLSTLFVATLLFGLSRFFKEYAELKKDTAMTI